VPFDERHRLLDLFHETGLDHLHIKEINCVISLEAGTPKGGLGHELLRVFTKQQKPGNSQFAIANKPKLAKNFGDRR